MEVLKIMLRRLLSSHFVATVKVGIFFLLVIVLTSMKSIQQEDRQFNENQLKAVFLYHFTQFIKWPAVSFENRDSPLVIGVLGKNPFNNYLNEVVQGEKVENRPIAIKYYSSPTPEINKCHILFIEESFAGLNEAIEITKGRPVLTVSDSEGFMKQSGILRFYVEGSKMRFEINQEAAAQSELEISSKLLRLATIYSN